eukprot:jgi/Mesvir1/1556/Mv14535-RA.1
MAPPDKPRGGGLSKSASSGALGAGQGSYPGLITAATKEPVNLGKGLVPLFLNVDREGVKLKEAFLWPLDDRPLSAISQRVAADLGVPDSCDRMVELQLNNTIRNYVKRELRGTDLVDMKLEVTLDGISYTDEIQWDLSEPMNCPDQFAAGVCADVGLPFPFIAAISAAIRKQCSAHELLRSEGKRKPVDKLPDVLVKKLRTDGQPDDNFLVKRIS